jgi:hypothetical protein
MGGAISYRIISPLADEVDCGILQGVSFVIKRGSRSLSRRERENRCKEEPVTH